MSKRSARAPAATLPNAPVPSVRCMNWADETVRTEVSGPHTEIPENLNSSSSRHRPGALGGMSAQIASFCADTRATIAVMFALLIVPVLGLASFGLERIQVSSFRQTLQTIADNGSQAGAATDEHLPEHQRRDQTVIELHKLLLAARLKPADVAAKVDFARPQVDEGVVATVSLEANTPLAFSLLPGRAPRIRVVASSGSALAAASERLVRCHTVATQSEFESLGC